MALRATLFDMDGLLVDSEILWHEAEIEIFGSLGVPLAEATNRSTKGLYVDEVVEFWFGLHPWSGPTPAQVSRMLLDRVGELIDLKGRLLPGAERALDLTARRGPIALASSTPLALIHHVVDHFGLRDRFVSLHSAEFEDYGKPHPAVFLSAARALNVPPDCCLVFEDSAAGVLAAKAARMSVVAVPTPADRPLATFAIADLVVDSLEDLTEDWLDERFVADGA
jgi:mannitol-1-/sugar-/sorbitol-6-/2-deoxyglucose-6-phosphatase